ncbi:hypothetical protein AN640_07110 [Candidatus Epulonipiscium fishelsonii]|uniref:Uncharacterized protein n=1 Tax=Candidatus Epulonipiscium fishelsonii TaxID=77094 RepID=A0ACC8XH67_9FIRM|nr:hypothetical protein AN640_07110 [Epulopiscium sp. SCG-D08WGA-EpuloA1]
MLTQHQQEKVYRTLHPVEKTQIGTYSNYPSRHVTSKISFEIYLNYVIIIASFVLIYISQLIYLTKYIKPITALSNLY